MRGWRERWRGDDGEGDGRGYGSEMQCRGEVKQQALTNTRTVEEGLKNSILNLCTY
jgi:hypothetical protein